MLHDVARIHLEQTKEITMFCLVTKDSDDGSKGTLRWALKHRPSHLIFTESLSNKTIRLSSALYVRVPDHHPTLVIKSIAKGLVTIEGYPLIIRSRQKGLVKIEGPLCFKWGASVRNYSEKCRLHVAHVSIHDNFRVRERGGGIFSLGPLTLNDVIVANNCSLVRGGGVYAENGLHAYMARITHNRVISCSSPDAAGGGIFVRRGPVLLDNCNIRYNVTGNKSNAKSGIGGGVFVYQGQLVCRQTDIAKNLALAAGGVALVYGDLTMLECTINNNCSRQKSVYEKGRGGLVQISGNATLMKSDINRNKSNGRYMCTSTLGELRKYQDIMEYDMMKGNAATMFLSVK